MWLLVYMPDFYKQEAMKRFNNHILHCCTIGITLFYIQSSKNTASRVISTANGQIFIGLSAFGLFQSKYLHEWSKE